MFYKTQWLLQMNVLLSNQISKAGEWTSDGNFCFKFSMLFSKCFYCDFSFTSVCYPFFPTCFEYILPYCSLFMHGRDARLSDKNYVVTEFSQSWHFRIILFAMVVVSKNTQRFWRELLEAGVLGGFSKISYDKLPMIVQMNLCGMLLRKWSFRLLRQPVTFSGF